MVKVTFLEFKKITAWKIKKCQYIYIKNKDGQMNQFKCTSKSLKEVIKS